MKKVLCGLFFLAGIILLSGCYLLYFNYNYWAVFRNIGTKRIWVDEFRICDIKEHQSPLVGSVVPEISMESFGPFKEKPYPSVKIRWQFEADVEKYGKVFEHDVTLNLPEEFNKKDGRVITFYIDPDNDKIYVSYKIEINPAEYDCKEINPDGTPFVLPGKTKKSKAEGQ